MSQGGDEDRFGIWVERPRVGVAVIRVRGELESATAPRLRRELASALNDGAECVVVDLAEVTFIDSLGLAALIDGARLTEQGGGGQCFAVTAAHSGVARLLTLTAVDRMIPTYATVDEAVGKMRSEPGWGAPAPGDPPASA